MRSSMRAVIAIAALVVGATPPPVHAHDFGKATQAVLDSQTLEAPLDSEAPGSRAQPVLYSFMARKLTWTAGSLGVCFWNGSATLRQKVASVADELTAGLPISFVWKPVGAFIDCPASGYDNYMVRVSLEPRPELLVTGDDATQYFATIGRAAQRDTRRATVNLPFPANPDQQLLRNKVLHEFCHTLGCLHEHQRGTCGFDKITIEANLLIDDATYERNFEQIPSTDAYYQPAMVGNLDRDSIMMYTFYRWMFLHPDTSPCFRDHDVTQLSPRDRTGLNLAYNAGVPIPQTVADFGALERTYAEAARNSRTEAAMLRFNTFRWAGTVNGLTTQQRLKLQQNVMDRVLTAERAAASAEDLSARYHLRPETVEKLDAAMKLLPAN